jgi:hypothetical protein
MASRASRLVSVFLVGAVGVFVAVVSPLANAGPVTRVAKPRSLVLTPHSGQAVRSYPFTVRVRASDGSGDLRATLNGHSIGSQFGPAQRGVRGLEVSISQGLKQGPNVLRVQARQSNSRWSRATVRFRLVVKGPLAGAGPDARVIVGYPYRLMGTGVASTGKPAVTGSTATFHWTLNSHPPNIGELGLSDPTAADSRFIPDVPGPYTLQLTYRDSRGSTSDTVTLDAVLPNPRVPIETMATEDGVPGIKVGPQFYPARTSFSFGYP